LAQCPTREDNVQHTQHIHVNTKLSELVKILEWFQSLEQASVTDEDWMQCQIALAEGFTNAVRHAHKELPSETPIEIDIDFYLDHIEMRIWDHGPPFSLMELLQAEQTLSDEEAESGRGIALLQKIANEIEYAPADGERNCLLLVKRSS
jgi:serine/threonine-protein kinase RsbW